MTPTTYLSEYVYNIVVECGKLTDSDGSDYVTPRLTYKWVEIKEAFGDLVGMSVPNRLDSYSFIIYCF